jgi:hypothetical protein
MTLQTVSDARYVRVGGQSLLAKCYEPETGDVVTVWPSDHSIDPDNPGLRGIPEVRRKNRKGEYASEDDPNSWPTNEPWVDLATA